MEHATNIDDVYHQMTKYSNEKPIQVTCIFEDSDSDDNSQLPEETALHTASQNENTNSATQQLNTQSFNHNCDNSANEVESRSLLLQYKRLPSDPCPKNHTNVQNEEGTKESQLKEILTSASNVPFSKRMTPNQKNQFVQLLDTVAENLIIITKYYHYFNLKFGINHAARENYLRYKNYYFDQSYSVLVSVFIPHENNQVFINKFINRTIAIANSQSWYLHMTVDELTVFVKGMIKWAKQKKMHQEASANQLQQLISASNAHSNQYILSPNRNSNFETRQTYVNSSLLPVVPPAVFGPTVPPPSNYTTKNNTYEGFNRPPPMYRQPLTSPAPECCEPPPKSCSNVYTKQQTNRSHPMYRPPPQLLEIPPPSRSTSKVNNIDQNKQNPTENHINNICIFSDKISISVDPAIAESVVSKNIRKAPLDRTSKRRKTNDENGYPSALSTNCTAHNNQLPYNIQNHYNPNQSPRISNPDNIMQPINNSSQYCPGIRQNDRESDNMESQPHLSRSVSRDSGFGSPVLCSMLLNNDNNVVFPSDNQKLAPEVPQMSSMNPNNDTSSISGACRICGTSTKYVCLACSKEYYCCSVCQTLDWPRHKIECRTR
ncbi:uncharacterized protein LOC112046206 [Bicyclus anynana]|uniref:Uncharacterized protein LOC112046206 n=1 Tax=Bicyclus anynana TaxID=110368 RepID=A0A6J1N033_BICAN|nr:uncharacterized protein LOC112046206 [Bicyclus anynana]XP_023938534.2 uncharacterized protein LOC112046206 [Bicyclus anynana]XP_052741375.1 uncharacterized protein LOC112046206 [Bicyclus anynana]